MAEEIVLVGQFRDEITPKLKKLNKELTKVTKNFTKLGVKLKPITADMKKLADESERVADALKAQKAAVDSNTRSWNAYKVAVGRAGGAQRQAFKGAPKGGKGPRTIPKTGGGAGGGIFSGAAAAGGMVLGGTISTVLTNAVVAGFRIGAQFITKPFTLFGSALNERIQDEMSDVRAAGGLFAISKRMQGGGFVSNFAEAEALTKEQNRYLAQLAGALPGDTQEYINVAKQISDGVYTVIAQDQANAVKFGEQLARERGADTSRFAQGGQAAMQAAGKEIVGELTKLTVLAGLGGQQGAFGLPQLTEQIIARDEVTLGQFQRYAAIFRDPMIKGALERNISKLNATSNNTTERVEAVRKMLQEVVTPELVRRYQRTTSGVLEALRTTFLNPEVGLLGLGRPLNIMAKTFDEFGNQITKNGKAVTEALSVFDYLRDIFANIMIVLQPVIEAATALFDPFTDLGNQLNRLRDATMFFQNTFERYRKGLENIANGLVGEEKQTFEATLTLRAALSAINNAFRNLGVYGKEEFDRLAKILKDPKKGMKEFQKVISDMVTKFLNSDGAKKIGEAIGGIIGTVVATVGKILAQIAGIATSGPLAEGFNAGFEAAGGKEGIKNIIKSVFELIGKGILAVFEAAPFEASLIAGLTLFGPAIASALGTAMLSAIGKAGAGLFAAKGAAGAAGAGGAGAAGAGGLAAVLASPAFIAAAAVAAVAVASVAAKKTEKMRQEFTAPLSTQANTMVQEGFKQSGQNSLEDMLQGWLKVAGGEFLWVLHDFIEGFGNLFVGLYDLVVGLFSDPTQVKEGIKKIFQGLWQLFTGIGHLIIGILALIPALISGLFLAVKNLFLGIGELITEMWDNRPEWMGGKGGTTEPSTTPKAVGGSVLEGRSYLVGEKGPEMFTPDTSGMIIPNNDLAMAGSGGVGVTVGAINISGVNDPQAIANQVADEILVAIRRASYSELNLT